MLDALSIRAKSQDWQTRAAQAQNLVTQAATTMSTAAANAAAIIGEYNAAAADVAAYVAANANQQHVADDLAAIMAVLAVRAKVSACGLAILAAYRGVDLSAGLTADNKTALIAALTTAVNNAAS